MRWSGVSVAAHRRAMLPVFGGICGSMSATWRATSAAPRVHLPPRIRAETIELVQRATLAERRPLLGAPVGARRPSIANQRSDLIVRRTVAERCPQVHSVG